MTPKEKLESIISEGKSNVPAVVANIVDEMDRRRDMIAKPAMITYDVDADGVKPNVAGEALGLTQHSMGQLYQRTEIPQSFGEKLIKLGEYDLLKQNLRTMTQKLNKNGMLFRVVDDTAKGILSPSYRRMDAAPIFDGFMREAHSTGYVPYRGFNTSYRYQLSFIWPELFEVAPGEWVIYGINITTGDYGSAALAMDMSILRVICTNLAIGYDLIRKVHIGKRFDMGEEEFIDISENTHALDTSTVRSAIGDIVRGSKQHLDLLNDVVKKGISKDVDAKSVIAGLKKNGVKKEITDKIQTMYDTDVGVEFLPQQKSAWRMSNTISLIAKGVQDADARIDLEKEAMRVLAA